MKSFFCRHGFYYIEEKWFVNTQSVPIHNYTEILTYCLPPPLEGWNFGIIHLLAYDYFPAYFERDYGFFYC